MTRAIPGRPGDLIWVDRNSQGHWLRNSIVPLDRNLAQLDDTERAALRQTCAKVLQILEQADRPVAALPQVHEPYDDDGALYCGWTGDTETFGGCGEAWPCTAVRERSA